jgi:hypothetical protein
MVNKFFQLVKLEILSTLQAKIAQSAVIELSLHYFVSYNIKLFIININIDKISILASNSNLSYITFIYRLLNQ